MRTAHRMVVSFGILLLFVATGFAALAHPAETTAPEKFAIVFNGKSNNAIPCLASLPGITIIEQYTSFRYVRATDSAIKYLRDNNVVVQLMPDAETIKFSTVAFDTSAGEPDIPARFRASEPSAGEYGYYVVQMKGPPKESWLNIVTGSGAVIADIVNSDTYIVKMTPETKSLLEARDFVMWTGLYHPYYKLRGGIEKYSGTVDMTAVFFKDADFPKSLDALNSLGGKVTFSSTDSDWWNLAYVKMDSQRLPYIASLPGIWFVEPKPVLSFDFEPVAAPESSPPGNGIFNDNARWTIQSGTPGSCPVWNNGIRGQNITVGIADTGIDYDHVAFTNTSGDHGTPGPGHRKIVRYWALADDWDEPSSGPSKGHGTHTSCSIAGNSIANPGNYNTNDGMIYLARLSFVDIWSPSTGWPSFTVSQIFNDASSYGAQLHSDSWGSDGQRDYNSMSQEVDQYGWDHPNFLALFAAGNEGTLGQGTIHPPSNAKNLVCVGACDNAGGQGIGVFSSKGPTQEGMIKPDIVAPGVDVTSADSDGVKDSYNSGYISHSGTSMATPVAAGGTALVQQYFTDGYYPSGSKSASDSFTPSGPLIKAILINSGVDLAAADARVPDYSQGWGRMTLDNSLYFSGDARKLWLYDAYNGGTALKTGDDWSQQISVGASQELKITLTWNDWAGAGLKNNLNLILNAPNGDTYIGNNYLNGESVPDAGAQPDTKNNVECVCIKAPEAGIYTINVHGAAVPSGGGQKFTVVVSGDVSESSFSTSLTAPTTGITINGGSSYNVQWASSGGLPPVTTEILYSNNSGGAYTSIADSQPESGQWTWNVPSANITTAKIKVVSTDGNSKTAQAESGDFTIKSASHKITLSAPNGGEFLAGGSVFPIAWTTSGGSGLKIDLFYSTNSGSTFNPIASNQTDSGSYSWTVPGIDSTTVRVKVTAVNALNESSSDISVSDFTIDSTAPVVSVMAPANGTLWLEGVHIITWTVNELIGLSDSSLNISYSKDDGTTWTPIVSSQPANVTSYNWNIAGSIESKTAKVKVSVFDKAGKTGTGFSQRFSIDTVAPNITHSKVTSSVKGAVIPITATVTDAVGVQTVILYYTSVGGSTFAQAAMTASGSTYSADIPAQATTGTLKYHICASDTSAHWAIAPDTVQSPSGDKNYTLTVKDSGSVGSISGTVKNTNSVPLSGASVTAFLSGSPVNSATTDGSGHYQISGLDPGTYSLTANKTGYLDGTLSGVTVTANSDTPGKDFTLQPWQPGSKGSISGTVNDVGLAPVSGAVVTAYLSGSPVKTATTDGVGHYQINGLDPGTYSLTANKTGFQDGTASGVVVTAGSNSADNNITLIPWQPPNKRSISGTVLDAGTSAPIAGAVVKLIQSSQTLETKITASDGKFLFQDLDPGTYTLNVTKTGYIGKDQQVDVNSASQNNVVVKLSAETTTPPTTPDSLPMFVVALIGVIAAAAVLLAVALALRRKKKREEDARRFYPQYQQPQLYLQPYQQSYPQQQWQQPHASPPQQLGYPPQTPPPQQPYGQGHYPPPG